ncbi:hypothetical protein Tco_0080260 [Tanacetum coccineum]
MTMRCCVASTPIETNKALIKDEEAKNVDVHIYRSMIRLLMYLTTSRPDIMFVVCTCARYSPFDLEAFFDSDYAGASLDKKSTTGGCQFLRRRLISWQCKKQTIVANSTTETETLILKITCSCFNGVDEDLTNLAKGKLRSFVSFREMITSQLQGKLWPYDEVHKTIYREWEDRIERAATIASILEAEQDSEAQTRFEAVSKQSNDPPHARVNTLGSGEDSIKLKELMELCIKLSDIYCDQHNMVALLEKLDGSEGFHLIVDFLNASHIRFALSKNPTIYDSHIKQFWQTATVNTLNNGE